MRLVELFVYMVLRRASRFDRTGSVNRLARGSVQSMEGAEVVRLNHRSACMINEQVREGDEVFVADTAKPFGAVRQVAPHGRREIVVYVENAGDFTIALDAVKAVHAQKVIVDGSKLDQRLRKAIGHAHDSEDPSI